MMSSKTSTSDRVRTRKATEKRQRTATTIMQKTEKNTARKAGGGTSVTSKKASSYGTDGHTPDVKARTSGRRGRQKKSVNEAHHETEGQEREGEDDVKKESKTGKARQENHDEERKVTEIRAGKPDTLTEGKERTGRRRRHIPSEKHNRARKAKVRERHASKASYGDVKEGAEGKGQIGRHDEEGHARHGNGMLTTVCRTPHTRVVRLGKHACLRDFSGVKVGDVEEGAGVGV